MKPGPHPELQGIMHRHYVQDRQAPRHRAMAAKQARYNELRDQGMTMAQAANEMGIDPYQTARRYEKRRELGRETTES